MRMRDQGFKWRLGYFNVPASVGRLTWQAIRGTGYRSDIAIDDITLRPGKCPSPGKLMLFKNY